jgi:radical SAM superfamily enzyme YgiQ (UPF0313 family)
MKMLFFIPPTDLEKSYGALKRFSNPQPSIGIAYLAAVLRVNGYDVRVLDSYVEGHGLNNILTYVKAYAPDIIGISLLTPSADVSYQVLKKIRFEFPKTIIVAGNLHASLFSEELLINDYVDFVVHGEGEQALLELVESLKANVDYSLIKGISYKIKGQVISTGKRDKINDLDSLPYPAWDLFPMNKYKNDPRTEMKKDTMAVHILATRGCPNQCTFCSSRSERSMGSRYRMRSPKNIADEIEHLHETYNATVFTFMDLAFPLVKQHAMHVCQEIINRGIHKKISWTTECRVNSLDLEILKKMKEAGCERVCFGIESGSNAILKSLKKNFETDDVLNAVRWARQAEIEVDGMFMIGLPGESEAEILKTIDFACQLNVRYAIFNIFVPYPGCELYDKLNKDNLIQYKTCTSPSLADTPKS